MNRRALLAAASLALPGAAASRAWARDEERDRPPPGMRARVFAVKHRDPDDLVHALRPLGSGVKGALIHESDSLRTITVRDFPENLAAIEQALKRLDVPVPPSPDLELRLRVLLASPDSGPGDVPADLANVVKQLTGTLSYKSYYLVATVAQRVRANSGASGRGDVQIGPPATQSRVNAEFRYNVEQARLTPAAAGEVAGLDIKRLKFSLEGDGLGEAEVSTALTLREGEQAALGKSSLRNRAMIVVLSFRVLR